MRELEPGRGGQRRRHFVHSKVMAWVGLDRAVRAVKEHHLDGPVDGLPGGEGVFLACSFWLADALHGIGRTDEARHLFERLLDVRNDVGLLAEEYDPVHRRHLGNTPQAFSLVGLVNTARRLAGSRTGAGARPPGGVPPADHSAVVRR